MTVVAQEDWRADGVSLMTYAHWIENTSGMDVINGRRQPQVVIPFRQGTPEIWDAPFNAKTISLNMIVNNTDADGNITHAGGGRAHLRENMDTLIGLFSKRDGTPIALARDVPAYPGGGVSTRTAEVTMIRQTTMDDFGAFRRRVVIGLYMPWPFWTGGPVTIPTMSPASFFVDGNVRTWPTITFNEPGRLIHQDTGQWIESSVAGAVVDCRNKTRSHPSAIQTSSPEWFALHPGQNDVDGPSVDIEFRPQWQ